MDDQRSTGRLVAIWFAFLAFLNRLFAKSPSPDPIPPPVTARASHRTTVVKEPTPLKHPVSAARSPTISSPASPKTTPKRAPSDPVHIPASPLLNISLSGIFATPPLLASPCIPPDVLASPSLIPSPFQASHGTPTPSLHTLHSRSPRTPRTPSSAVIVHIDRSSFSPTTMSDGSLEVISLGDRRGFAGSPLKLADMARLPSPWSPTGATTPSDVWMSVEGMLVTATGPVDDSPSSSTQDDSAALPPPVLASLTMSRISSSSLYSSSSALDALGITVFVDLDGVEDPLSTQTINTDTRDDPIRLNQVRDENRPTLVAQAQAHGDPQTPRSRRRRDTLPSVTRSGPASHSSRATKALSTPLTRLDNTDISHGRSASSISSMAYELRLGLFSEGKSTTAIETIISMLDQTTPESTRARRDSTSVAETV